MSAAASHRAEPAGPWTGTGGLLLLHLRLDRVRIAAWTLATGLLVAASVAALETTYPTQESLQARAELMSNPSAIMMTGPAFALESYTFGAMLANELSLYVFLAAAVMSVLLGVRHTRAEEEAGRTELLRALPVGRFAPATAAVLTVAIADVLVGAAVALGLVGTGMATASSLALGAGTTLTGLVFAAVATVTAQLTEHTRGATGMAMGAVAAAFLVRGVGDVLDNQGSWLSWFSPFAWAQQTRLYVELRWWPLALSAATTVALFVLAVSLARRRDLGAGLRRPTPGPATAARGLLSPAGLALRLLRPSFLTWSVATFLFAVAFGALANSLEDAVGSIEGLEEWIQVDLGDLTTSFAAATLSFLVVAPVVFVVAGVLRLRAEEEAGRAEAVLTSGSSRTGLLRGWLMVVAAQTVAMVVLVGAGTGLGVWSATGDVAWVSDLTLAALAYLPATLLVGAVTVALYGIAPRWAGWAWALVLWVTVVLYLGQLLGLPQWALNLSPVTHTPLVPQEDPEAVPLLVLAALGAVGTAAGFAGFRRRDVGA